MQSPSINRTVPIILLFAAFLAVAVIALAGYSVASAPGVGRQPEVQAPLGRNPSLGTQITEDEAHGLVWDLPEVQAIAERLRAKGSRPITLTLSKPDSVATAGTQEAAYYIRLSEDRGDHVAAVETFTVDSYTRQVSFYDVAQGRTVSLEEWRGRR